jgi:iron complex outermembrane receptor protein
MPRFGKSVVTLVAVLVLGIVRVADAQQLAMADANRPRFLLASDSRLVRLDVDRTPSLTRRLGLSLECVRLKRALAEIASRAGLRLAFSDNDIPLEKRVHLRAEAITVAAALTDVLLGTGLDVVFGRDGGASLVKRSEAAVAQPGRVVGQVTDQQKSVGIVGAEVLLEGTKWRTLTGEDGRYLLAEVASGSYTITARRIGYGKQSEPVTVGDGQEVTAEFALQPVAATLGELVVTAQRREESLKDVPISISVMPGRTLDRSNVEGVTEALRQVPGVSAFPHTQAGGTFLSVRGVSASGPVFGGASPIAYYLDGVPFGLVQTAIAPDAAAYDLERVEVLRGPQGTLYGASAQGGVVRVLSNDANPDSLELKARGSASTTDDGTGNVRGDMALNVPIIKHKLAARAVAGYENLGGWIDQPIKRDVNDAEIRNGRLKINARPMDRLTVGLSAWLSRNDYGGVSAGDDLDQRTSLIDESYSVDYDAYDIRIGYELPAFSVASTTSYLNYSSGGNVDLHASFGTPTALPLFTGFDADVIAEELNLSSRNAGSWRWTLGAIYRNGRDHTFQNIPSVITVDWTDRSESYAAFGELTRLFLGGRLEGTIGGRYFHDDVVTREGRDVAPVNPPLYYREADRFHSTTPRVVLAWHPVPDISVYGSYSEGFRSGSPQHYYVTGGVPGFPPVKPDKLHNYELGAKGDVGRVLSFDAAFYYLDWTDVQQQLTVLFESTPVVAVVNGESASGIGVDLGVTARPVEGLDVGLNMSWNNLKMDADIFSAGTLLFAKGDRPNFSPQYTLAATTEYSFPLTATGYRGRLSTSANYSSRQGYRTVVGGAQALGFGNSMVVARTALAVQAPRHWELSVFADNINNEQGAVVGNPFFGTDGHVRVRPRTVGAQLEYRF